MVSTRCKIDTADQFRSIRYFELYPSVQKPSYNKLITSELNFAAKVKKDENYLKE